MKAEAPWTPAQVKHLWRWQMSDHVHPFTCQNRGDGNHIVVFDDIGALVPTARGWICVCCDYTQTWAHDFMANGEAMRVMRGGFDGPDTIP